MTTPAPFATINVHGTSLAVYASRYRFSNRMALQLVDVVGQEDYATFTVNMPEEPLAEGEFLVKTWSENAPLRQPMLDTGLFEDTGRRVSTGFCRAEVWKLR